MMKVCVWNGSPKGDYSITLQTVLFLQDRYPQCTFEILPVGQKIRMYEQDMREALAAIADAELLLFCYPVYTFLAPYQLHRFIELVKESGADVSGKFAAQISTSKHFYDVTAHGYIRDNCLDMGLRYLGGLSADMDDLLCARGRAEAAAFWDYTLFCAQNGLFETSPAREAAPLPPYTRQLEETPRRTGFDTVIVTNREPDDAPLPP